MDEKTMVSDALVGINGELKAYAEYITQTENPQLKQTLKQMRNKTETAQEQLYNDIFFLFDRQFFKQQMRRTIAQNITVLENVQLPHAHFPSCRAVIVFKHIYDGCPEQFHIFF